MFRNQFSGYIYPFLEADKYLNSLPLASRQTYFRQVHETLVDDNGEMKGFMNVELESQIRHFYAKMACGSTNEVEFTAYRLTLLFIKEFEKRLLFLASKHKEELNSLNQSNYE